MSQQEPSLIEQLAALEAFDGTAGIGHQHRIPEIDRRRLADLDCTPIGMIHRQAAVLYDDDAPSLERAAIGRHGPAATGILDEDGDDAA